MEPSQSTKGRIREDEVQHFLFVLFFLFPGVAFVLDCFKLFCVIFITLCSFCPCTNCFL